MRTLLAEDDRLSRRALGTALYRWGYDVISCSDGIQAWEQLKAEDPPEIAVLDWMMPGMDGREICLNVRRLPNPTSTYIILLTSRDEDLDVIRGLEAGADDYIRKPFDQSLLRARVRVGERLVAMQRQHLQRETARYVEQLETAVSELRRSRRRIVEAQEQARRAIADELHGTVQTQVYALWLKLTAIGPEISESPDQARRDLSQAADDLDRIREQEIRQISHRLHPAIIKVGLATSVRSLRDNFERWIPVELTIAPEVSELEPLTGSKIPSSVRLGLYRVVEEALSNVIKHAGASMVKLNVSLGERGSHISVSIRDDGRGFDMESLRRGLGMSSMEDHLDALGGSLRVDSAPGKGTSIVGTAPVSTETDLSRTPFADAPPLTAEG